MSETILPPFAVTAAAIRQLEVLGGSARVDIEDGGCCGRTYVFTREPVPMLPAVGRRAA